MNRLSRLLLGIFGTEFWTQEELDAAEEGVEELSKLLEESDMIGKNVLAINKATLIEALSEYFEDFLDDEGMRIHTVAVVDDDDINLNLILVPKDEE